MAEIIEPGGRVVPSGALVPYIHPTLTNKTPVAWPLLVGALRALAIFLIEWGTLRWMEHAPEWAYVSSTMIAIASLIIIEQREWLNFRGRLYFPCLIAITIVGWVGVVGCAYYQVSTSKNTEINPAVLELQTQLAAALRQRDIALSERDGVRRENGDSSPSLPIPSIPASMDTDEIDERIDAWTGVQAQMGRIDRILDDAESMVMNWKGENVQTILKDASNIRQEFDNTRNTLQGIFNANGQFSDLNVIKNADTSKLSIYLYNLVIGVNQIQAAIDKGRDESELESYMSPVARQVSILKKWVFASRNVASSSILELKARRESRSKG